MTGRSPRRREFAHVRGTGHRLSWPVENRRRGDSSVLALLTHTVPTSDVWRRSVHWGMGAGFGSQASGHRVFPENVPMSTGSSDCAAVADAAKVAGLHAGTFSFAPRCLVSHDIGNTPSPQP